MQDTKRTVEPISEATNRESQEMAQIRIQPKRFANEIEAILQAEKHEIRSERTQMYPVPG